MTYGLILDADGVLANTADAHLAAFNTAFEEAGLEFRWDAAMYVRLSRTAGPRGQLVAYFDRFGWPGGEAGNDALVDAVATAQLKAFCRARRNGDITLIDGASALVESAQADGADIAVVGDGHVDAIAACTSLLGLSRASAISAIVAGDDLPARRPDPETYARACAALGLEPSTCIAITASVAGRMAAVAAGCDTRFLASDAAPAGSGYRVVQALHGAAARSAA